MVSVSRRAAQPQRGQSTWSQDSIFESTDPPMPVISTSRGNSTGRSSSGTGTSPHSPQWIIGMGVPQYRCREIPQSRNRQAILGSP